MLNITSDVGTIALGKVRMSHWWIFFFSETSGEHMQSWIFGIAIRKAGITVNFIWPK